MNSRHGNPTALNRHDRKRGMQPKETTCRARKADLSKVPVKAFDVSSVLAGFLEPAGQPGAFIIQALAVYGGAQTIVCGDCGAVAYHILVADYYTVPETVFFDAGEDPDLLDSMNSQNDPI